MDQTIDQICIIDDDDIYQFTTSIELKKTKRVNQIMTFSNGEEAIQYFKEIGQNYLAPPDLIFLDINMPVMDGWQFLEEYNKLLPVLTKTSKIFIVSSSVNHKDKIRSNDNISVRGYITKPITKEKLLSIFDEELIQK